MLKLDLQLGNYEYLCELRKYCLDGELHLMSYYVLFDYMMQDTYPMVTDIIFLDYDIVEDCKFELLDDEELSDKLYELFDPKNDHNYKYKKVIYKFYNENWYKPSSNINETLFKKNFIFPVTNNSVLINGYSDLYSKFNGDLFNLDKEICLLTDKSGNIKTIPTDEVRIYHPHTKKNINAIVHMHSFINNKNIHLFVRKYNACEIDVSNEFSENNNIYSEYIKFYMPNVEMLIRNEDVYYKDYGARLPFINLFRLFKYVDTYTFDNYGEEIYEPEYLKDIDVKSIPVGITIYPYKNYDSTLGRFDVHDTLLPNTDTFENRYEFSFSNDIRFTEGYQDSTGHYKIKPGTPVLHAKFIYPKIFKEIHDDNTYTYMDVNEAYIYVNNISNDEIIKYYCNNAIILDEFGGFTTKSPEILLTELEIKFNEKYLTREKQINIIANYFDLHVGQYYNTFLIDTDDIILESYKPIYISYMVTLDENYTEDDADNNNVLYTNILTEYDNNVIQSKLIEEIKKFIIMQYLIYNTNIENLSYVKNINEVNNDIFKKYKTLYLNILLQLAQGGFFDENGKYINKEYDEFGETAYEQQSAWLQLNVAVAEINDIIEHPIWYNVYGIAPLEGKIIEDEYEIPLTNIFTDWDEMPLTLCALITLSDAHLGITYKSNIINITKEWFKYLINKSDTDTERIDLDNMEIKNNNINLIDKVTCYVKKENDVTETTIKGNILPKVILKPMFYRTETASGILIRKGTTQNIGINLLNYLTKVESFYISINGYKFNEIGRTGVYTVFEVNAGLIYNTTDESLSSSYGTYDVCNLDGDYITSGSYTII